MHYPSHDDSQRIVIRYIVPLEGRGGASMRGWAMGDRNASYLTIYSSLLPETFCNIVDFAANKLL